jgi:uncharacterized membrane protein YeiB
MLQMAAGEVVHVYVMFVMICVMPFAFRAIFSRMQIPVTANCLGVVVFVVSLATLCWTLAAQAHSWKVLELCGPMVLLSFAGLCYFIKALAKSAPKTQIQK